MTQLTSFAISGGMKTDPLPDFPAPTIKNATHVERWVYLGIRQSGSKKGKTAHMWQPLGDEDRPQSRWFKHGGKGDYAPSVGAVFFFDVNRSKATVEDPHYVTIWFGSRRCAGVDHGLDEGTISAARRKDRAWRAERQLISASKKATADQELEEALDVLSRYYWETRSSRAAVLGWFIQRITTR